MQAILKFFSDLFRIISLVWNTGGSTKPTPPGPGDTTADPNYSDLEIQVLDAHNQLRRESGLPFLVLNPMLARAARKYAAWMAANNIMPKQHTGPNGNIPVERMEDEGYKHARTGENIASGYKTVASVMDGWWGSRGHRANILGDYVEIGVGQSISQSGKVYWCVDFGKPSGARMSITSISNLPGGLSEA